MRLDALAWVFAKTIDEMLFFNVGTAILDTSCISAGHTTTCACGHDCFDRKCIRIIIRCKHWQCLQFLDRKTTVGEFLLAALRYTRAALTCCTACCLWYALPSFFVPFTITPFSCLDRVPCGLGRYVRPSDPEALFEQRCSDRVRPGGFHRRVGDRLGSLRHH